MNTPGDGSHPAPPGLFQRRLPHAAAAYVAGSWGIIEITVFFVEKYGLPPFGLHALVSVLVAGLPATLVLTWRHGLPGSQRFTARELAAAGVIFAVTLAAFWRFPLLKVAAPGAGRPPAAATPLASSRPGSRLPPLPPRPPPDDLVVLTDPGSFRGDVRTSSLGARLAAPIELSNVKDVEAAKLLSTIARLSGTNILVNPHLAHRKLTMRLVDVPVHRALDAICLMLDATWTGRTGILEVEPSSSAPERPRILDFSTRGETARVFFRRLEKLTPYRFRLAPELADRRVDLDVRRVRLDALLRALARRLGVRVELEGATLRVGAKAPWSPWAEMVSRDVLEDPASNPLPVERLAVLRGPSGFARGIGGNLEVPIKLSNVKDIPAAKLMSTIALHPELVGKVCTLGSRRVPVDQALEELAAELGATPYQERHTLFMLPAGSLGVDGLEPPEDEPPR